MSKSTYEDEKLTGSGSGSSDRDESTAADGQVADRDVVVSVDDLVKEYGNGEDAVTAVDGVDLDIEAGTAVGLLGPNGAGKTTTIKSILSLVVPTSGRVEVHGTNVHRDPSTAFEHLGAMLEGARNAYWRLTVRENLEMFSCIAGRDYRKRSDRLDELLEQFSLTEKADTPVKELSRGQKQKVSLACTIARDADVVFLDEPTLGLDVESSMDLREELRRLVEEDGLTVVLSSHDMAVIQEVCDRVVIMNEGEVVVDDDVEDLLNVFNTQAYEVAVEEPVEDDLRAELSASFDAQEFERNAGTTTFEAKVVDDEFYDLVHRLEDAGLSIASVDHVEPDLEEVFLHVTDRDDPGVTADE